MVVQPNAHENYPSLFSCSPGSDANTAFAISTIGTDRSCDVR